MILKNAPTQYGLASVTFKRAADLVVTLEGNPPLGWRLRLPGAARRASVDDGPFLMATAGEVRLGPGAHRIVVQ